MRFGVFYELQLPKPWTQDSEHRLFTEALEQIELADRIGVDYAWAVEHHFLDEYSHCSAPDFFFSLPGSGAVKTRLTCCSSGSPPVRSLSTTESVTTPLWQNRAFS